MQSSKQSIQSLHLFTYFLWVRELLPKLKYKIYAGINAWAAAFFWQPRKGYAKYQPFCFKYIPIVLDRLKI